MGWGAGQGWGRTQAKSGRELTRNTSSRVSSREQLNLKIPSWRSGYPVPTRLRKRPREGLMEGKTKVTLLSCCEGNLPEKEHPGVPSPRKETGRATRRVTVFLMN